MGILDDVRKGLARVIAGPDGWAIRSDEDVPFSAMKEALTKAGFAEPTEEKPRALFHDPYAIMDWGGWRQRPSALTYDTLREMATVNTVIAAIIITRCNQVGQFGRPQQGPYDRGYRVMLRDRRDKNRSMSKAEQAKATEIERMLETTGLLLPDEKPSDRDSFRAFLKKEVRDALTYDQMCFEKIRDRSGGVSRFIALPAETIRPAVTDIEHMDPEERRNRVAYVQVYDDSIVAEFGPDDMAWCIMNPRTDLRVNGFGFSPIEQIVRLVTAWLFGFEYNTRFFTQGSAIKGVLNVKGAIPDRQLRAFRRMWYSMVSGVGNAWKTPILNAEDLQWVSMHSANREMEFSAWMDWLTKLICAVYGVDPVEINFQFGNTGQKSALNTPSNEEKVVESKDKGLRPLVDHIADSLNLHIVWELEEDFEFAFTGLDAKAEEKEREARLAEVKAIKTVNQIRAEMGDPPLKNGDVILDPNWITWQQSAQMGQGGTPPPAGPDDELKQPDGASAESPLSDDQEEALYASMSVLREAIDELRKSGVEPNEAEIELLIKGTFYDRVRMRPVDVYDILRK